MANASPRLPAGGYLADSAIDRIKEPGDQLKVAQDFIRSLAYVHRLWGRDVALETRNGRPAWRS